MVGFLERVANLVVHMFSLLCVFVISVVLHFGFNHSQITKRKNKIIQIIKYYINIYLLFHQNVEKDV